MRMAPRTVRASFALSAVAAAALLVTGCNPSSTSASSSSSGSAATTAAPVPTGNSPSAAATTAAPSATSPAASSTAAPTPAKSTSASGSGGSGTGASGTAQSDCTSDELTASVAGGQGAAGSQYVTIDFTNKSGTTCSLYGYPGVSLDNSGGEIGAAATRDSSHGGPSRVTLAPGAKANTIIRVADAGNYPSSKCTPDSASFLKIYPPNNTVAIDVPYKSTGCRSTSVGLLSTTVVASGAGSN